VKFPLVPLVKLEDVLLLVDVVLVEERSGVPAGLVMSVGGGGFGTVVVVLVVVLDGRGGDERGAVVLFEPKVVLVVEND
jgi:hypothetical protein